MSNVRYSSPPCLDAFNNWWNSILLFVEFLLSLEEWFFLSVERCKWSYSVCVLVCVCAGEDLANFLFPNLLLQRKEGGGPGGWWLFRNFGILSRFQHENRSSLDWGKTLKESTKYRPIFDIHPTRLMESSNFLEDRFLLEFGALTTRKICEK